MKRTFASLAIAVTASIGLAACGSSAPTTNVTGTDGKATQAAAAQLKVGDTVSLADLSKTTTAAVMKAKSAKFSATESGAAMTGEVIYAPSFALKMSGGSGDQALDIVFVDEVFYVGGSSAAAMSGGKKFVKIDPNGTDAMSKSMGSNMARMKAAMNPGAMLADLADVQAKVSAVGNGTVTYTATLTAEQASKVAAKALSGSGQSQTPATQMKASTFEQIVDSEGRPTKITLAQEGETGAPVTFSDWGGAITIEAPPASDVGTFQMPTGG